MSSIKVSSINNEAAVSGGLTFAADGKVSGAGADLISAQTFTSVSAVSFDNVFTSTYQNYLVVAEYSQTATDMTKFRYRVGGVDNTASVYTYAVAQYIPAWGGLDVATGSAATVGYCSAAARSVMSLQVLRPAEAVPKFILIDGSYGLRLTGQNSHSATTAFDGFTLYPQSGTFSGTIRVYGLRN